MREVKKLFDDYKENISAWKVYEKQQIEDQYIPTKVTKWGVEKVSGGKIVKEDEKMANRINRANANANAIKRIKADLRPFLIALNKVSEEQKELLRSRYIKCRSVDELAEEFGLTISVARNRLKKAEQRFYRLYQNYAKEDNCGII